MHFGSTVSSFFFLVFGRAKKLQSVKHVDEKHLLAIYARFLFFSGSFRHLTSNYGPSLHLHLCKGAQKQREQNINIPWGPNNDTVVCKLSSAVIVYHVWNDCSEVAISLVLLSFFGAKMNLGTPLLFLLHVLILYFSKLMGAGNTWMFLINGLKNETGTWEDIRAC